MRLTLALAALLCCISAQASPAWGQIPAPAVTTGGAGVHPPAPTSSSAVPPALSPEQASRALSVLRDDAKRAEIIGVLEALARVAPSNAAAVPASAATPGAPPAANAASAPAVAPAGAAADKLSIPLAPNSLGAQLIVGASHTLDTLSTEVGDTARKLTNFTLFLRWLRDIADDPDSQAALLDAGWKLFAIAVVGLAAERLAKLMVARPVRALARAAPSTVRPTPGRPAADNPEVINDRPAAGRRRAAALVLLRRVPFTLARLLLDVLPVIVAGTVGYGALGTRLGSQSTSRLVILAIVDAYLLCRLITVATRALLSPSLPSLRLLPFSDDAAAWLLRWVRRIAALAVFGYAAAEVALLFGLYRVAHDAMLKLVALAGHAMLVLMVLQKRRAVARWIRPRDDRSGVTAAVRRRLARVWHITALFYIVALWLVWALDVPDGFARLVRIFVATVIVGAVSRLASVLSVAAMEHAMMPDAASGASPGLGSAARRYLPLLRMLTQGAIIFAAMVLLLWFWGIDSFAWFDSGALGGRMVSAMITIAVIMLIAVGVWEAINAGIQAHLARLTRDAQAARSARLRTLLPMLRTALFVAISLFAGLTILSQIGVNIAPLLAGAGVVGLAIGFGSQKLVQDIITGLFLLLENTMQVGDVVTLAGLTGTVENLSIRTIRLRALDGSVHIVPFSAVTTVTNMTRDFSYALLDVSVGLNEEPDRVAAVVREVADGMREESRWRAAIQDSIEIMGVERFIDTAWVLRCRVKTVPSQRWAVGRELNRRIKYRFDLDKIESPFTSYRALAQPNPPPPNAKTPEGEVAA